MTEAVGQQPHLWSIVLAGGDGERIRPLTERWLGRHTPKQYCAFVGTRSMLQHTLDRAARLSAPERTVTVIARGHLPLVRQQLSTRQSTIIPQPLNRDTAVGMFLALTYVRAADPEATVVILPADHFVHPEARFLEAVRCGVWAAELLDRAVLLGVAPDRPEPEYGWIQPGPSLAWTGVHRVRAVQAFLEKPGLEKARAAMARGALWNTFVLAARLETLSTLGWCYLPEVMLAFERLSHAIGTRAEEAVLDSVYAAMPARNFSSDILQRAPARVAVIELSDILWSDWGRADRILETLRRIGKCPAFSVQHVS